MKELVITQRQDTDSNLPIFRQTNPVLARIYASRGIHDLEGLGRNLKELLPDSGLAGMDAAIERLVVALKKREKIMIIGDFDCDGATSTAVAVLALRMMGAEEVSYLVPNRFEYGYGLSPEIVMEALKQAPDLLITVDNGISSIEGVAAANIANLDVIVTDHHLAGQELPAAYAIVNPNQPDCRFSAKSTCGVGVIFYVMIALRRKLQALKWFEEQGLALPNLGSLLDLVALGTVADVVPLEQNNRVLVYQGLQRIKAGRCRPGIKALIELSGRQQHKIASSDLGYALAPRLNAAGRLEDMSIGIECLLTESEQQAKELAATLNDLNQERKGIEQEMQQQALDLLAHLQLDDEALPYGLSLYEPEWHQGVIGILASRIKEKTHRPVIAFAQGDEGELKGSARSIPGFHIRDGLDAIAAKHPALLRKFGGHAMAAGLTISDKDLGLFQQAFDSEVRRQLSDADLQQQVITDGALSANDMTIELAEMLRDAGPWGHQFPEPLFEGEFSLLQQRIVGHRHLKMVLMEPASGLAVDAIQFNADMDQWPDESKTHVRVIYRLDVNEFRGRKSVQMLVDHLLITDQ
ncbi:single-stranded-DNA-specific exonuclease RecJ [Neptuniibacter sp. 2_MG-2023]|uniref:single-stranded-DNA-specific exonuclease RecJ n=1 Tax=Neptuniibacter sp. 2_MG-2023 TaxID=3062671 RepID=UPI0026E20B47|nr:single-stranded-DNA-specific exonuclease RecJ [Neptuniibacter sp. 2_MG-2023]MDO6513739.1 single-stranded-DNA-specific exonuclease RecJ [Neptuniibacter sp. 2_MG-2023]